MGRIARSHRLRAGELGSSLVEFALTVTLLLMLVFGIMDCSRAMYVDHFVANAAREATRYAMVRGASWGTTCASTLSFGCTATSANVSDFVTLIAPAGIDPTKITVTTTWPGTDATGVSCITSGSSFAGAGCVVAVKVVYSFTFVLPFLPKTALLLPSTSKVSIAE